jgi:predicted transcriptional regulator
MSEEKVQETVQENLDIKVESKPEAADSGLLQEVMAKKATIKELQAKLGEYETANEKARQKQLSEDGKKDELISELNSKVEKLEGEYTRLSKYEDDEKTNLIASIASDTTEAEQLENESLSTLRLLKNKIASATPETPTPTARGSVGNQPPPEDWTNMDERTRRKNWGNILKSFKN